MNKIFSIKKKRFFYFQLKIEKEENDKKTMQRRMIFVFLVKYIYF